MTEKREINLLEEYFIEAYETTGLKLPSNVPTGKNYDGKTTYNEPITEAQFPKIIEALNRIALVPEEEIKDYEIFTKPDFVEKSFERDPITVFNAIVEIAKLLHYLCDFLENEDPNKIISANFAGAFSYMKKDKWENVKQKKFVRVVQTALALFFGQVDLIKLCYNSDMINFINKNILMQNYICQSRIYPIILEVFTKVFIKRALDVAQPVLKTFLDKKTSTDKDSCRDLISFINLLTTAASLWPTADFSNFAYESAKDYFHDARDTIQPDLFCAIVNLFTALCYNKDTTTLWIKHVNNMSSDIINFKNFFLAITGHANIDFGQSDLEQSKLSQKDSAGMISLLKLLTKIAKIDYKRVGDLLDKSGVFKGKDGRIEILHALISLTLSSIPADVKAACFDLIGAMSPLDGTQYWSQIISSSLITNDILDAKKGGLLDDMQVEQNVRCVNITRSFVRMINSLLMTGISPSSFDIFERFLFELALSQIASLEYNYPMDKWGLLCDVSQAWTTLLTKQPPKTKDPLLSQIKHSQEFIQVLVPLIIDDDCPLECLLCVFRLIFLLAKETAAGGGATFASVESQLSWNQDVIKKLMRCVSCIDYDLQIVAIHVLQLIAQASPDVAQVMLSKQHYRAIDVLNYVISYDEPEDGDEMNVRCSALSMIVSLNSNSFFLRHVCGFDQHDPPLSIVQSSLMNGILQNIITKLHMSETHVRCPLFTSLALRLLLILAEDELTRAPVLNLLRSQKDPFFVDQMKLLRSESSLLSSIGYFLKLLSIEAADNVDVVFTASTQAAFDMLLTDVGGATNAKRNILGMEFVDRIGSDEGSFEVADGLQMAIVSYLMNSNSRTAMKEATGAWRLTWAVFDAALLERLCLVSNTKITESLATTAANIAQLYFNERAFGEPEDTATATILGRALNALMNLREKKHPRARIGVFSIINACLSYKRQPQLSKLIEEFEPRIVSCISEDVSDETPALRSAAFAAAECLVGYSGPRVFKMFVEQTIGQTESDWKLYKDDPISGAFVIKAKCSFYSRFIAIATDKTNPKCDLSAARIFVELGIVHKMSKEGYWQTISNLYSTCTTSEESEMNLILGSKILRLFATLAAAFNKSSDVRRHLMAFIRANEDGLTATMHFGGNVTPVALDFIADIISLMFVVPGLSHASGKLVEAVPHAFMRFADEDALKTTVRERTISATVQTTAPPRVLEEAQRIVSRLMVAAVTFLAGRAEDQLVFDQPLVGDEWRGQKGKSIGRPPLAVVTAYVTQLLGNTTKLSPQARVAANMCLLIIWRHLDRWGEEKVDFDVGTVRSQAKVFAELPFSALGPDSGVDTVMISKIAAFASDK